MHTSRNPSGKRRRRIAIVGGGQAGLQLALGLTGAGYAVTLTTECDADALERGTVRSTQCMFDAALRTERRLGLDHWHALRASDPCAGRHDRRTPTGPRALAFTAPLRSPAQSVDQRVKLPRWLRDLEARGGAVRVGEAEPAAPRGARRRTTTSSSSRVERGALARIFNREDRSLAVQQPAAGSGGCLRRRHASR